MVDLEKVDESLCGINRQIRLSIAFEKDIKKQNKLIRINRLLGWQ